MEEFYISSEQNKLLCMVIYFILITKQLILCG